MSFPTEYEYKVLRKLLDEKVVNPGTAAAGIIEQVLQRGYDSMTKRQRHVFNRYVVDVHCQGHPTQPVPSPL